MEALISLIALFGVGYAGFCGFKWIIRNGHIQSGKNAPLSPSDLRVLEESAERLMADMRIVTDECVARIEQACFQAQSRLESLEPNKTHLPGSKTDSDWAPIPLERVPSLDSLDNLQCLNRQSDMTLGELELMRGLKTLEHRQ